MQNHGGAVCLWAGLCTGGFGPKAAAKLLLALQLPGYSEFLLSFALLYVLVWALHGALRRVVAHGWAVALAAAAGLAADIRRLTEVYGRC